MRLPYFSPLASLGILLSSPFLQGATSCVCSVLSTSHRPLAPAIYASARSAMGNSQTKETRSSLAQSSRRHHPSAHSSSRGRSPYGGRYGDSGNGPDLSFLGIGGSSDRHAATLEHRRETKQEREARRLEKERAARIKERERSMKEEHIDGGYLVTQGVYVGTEDFNKAVVRRLMVCFCHPQYSFCTSDC